MTPGDARQGGIPDGGARLSEVRASDGYRLRYRVWPDPPSPRADVILLNGVMSNSAWFAPLVPALRDAGLRLVGADRRGSACNEEGRGDAPSAKQLVDDVLAIVEAEHAPERPLLLVGWCWGASLALAVSQELGPRLRGLVLVTPGMFVTSAVQRAMADQRDVLQTASPEDPVVRSPILETYFTAGPALKDFILRDPHRVTTMTPRLVEVSARLSSAAVMRLRKQTVPILLVLAEDEQATDNEATLRAFGRLSPTQWQSVTVPGKHGVQFDAPDRTAAAILEFARALGV